MKRAASVAGRALGGLRNILLLVCAGVGSDLYAQDARFVRGNSNGDHELDVSDSITVLRSLFSSEPGLPCEDAADSNDDGAVNIADAAHGLSFLFGAGAPPPAPYPGCGGDPTQDDLGCGGFAFCDTAPVPCDNLPPRLDPLDDVRITLGSSLALRLTASDPEGDEVVFDVDPLPLPARATLDARTGEFSFRPGAEDLGSLRLTFIARDGGCGGEARRSVTVTVSPSPSGRTSLSGTVLTTGRSPLAGVRLALGAEAAFTGARGEFLLDGLPSGTRVLLVDGTTVPPARGTFPMLPMSVELLEAGANVLDDAIVLLPLDVESGDPIAPGRESVVTSRPVEVGGAVLPAVALTVSAGSARAADTGEPFAGSLHITSIPLSEPPPLSLRDGSSLSLLVALEPAGVAFDPPARIAFPNVERFPAAAVVDIFGLDLETGELEKVGEGVVGADGRVHSVEGVVTRSSWYGFAPKPPVGEPAPGRGPPPPGDRDDEPVGSTVSPRTGDLTVGHDLVAYHSLGVPRSLRLEYHTSTARPWPIVAASVSTENFSPPPEFLAAEVTVAGVNRGREVTEAPPACVSNCRPVYITRAIDATALPTGVYPSSIAVDFRFPMSSRRVEFHVETIVINHRASAFGGGWSLRGLQRLHRIPGDGFLLTSGDDSAALFRPAARAAAEIRGAGERDYYHFAASRGDTVTIAMSRTTNRADGSGSLNPAVELRSSDGLVLARDDDGGSNVPGGPGRNARIESFVLPATDTYAIVASGRGGSRGSYHLTLSTTDARGLRRGRLGGPAAVRPSFTFLGEVTSAARRRRHTFAASVGTRVSIRVDRLDNLPDGRGTLDPTVELRGSNGLVIARDNDGGTARPPGPGRNALIARQTLPATDAYEIIVSGASSTLGPYEIAVTFEAEVGSIETPDDGLVSIERPLVSPPRDGSRLTVNEDGSATRRLKNGTVIAFDARGLQTAVTDRSGNATSYTYDAGSRLVRIEDPVGLVTRLRYSGGLVSEIEGPAGRLTRLQHDASGNLIRIEDPDGTTRVFTYGAGGLMTSQRNQRDFVTAYEYDFSGRLARSRLPDGSERSVVASESVGLVDPASGLGTEARPAPVVRADEITAELTDGEGRTRSFLTGAAARFTGVRSAAGLMTGIGRDDSGHPTSAQSPGGLEYSYSHDDLGNLGRVVDEGLEGELLFDYDPSFSQPSSVTDAMARTAFVEQDDRGYPLRLTTAAGRTVDLDYDERGLLSRVLDQIGAETRFEYDGLGNVTRIIRRAAGEERVLSLEYTAEGYPGACRDAAGNVTRYRYDRMGRISSLTRPDQSVIRFQYDAAGNLVSLQPPGRAAHGFAYSPANLMEESTPPRVGNAGDPTTYAYNRAAQLMRVSRPGGGAVTLERDEAGRTTALSLPGGEIRYSFEALSGLLTTITSPGGAAIEHDHDGGRLVRETWTGAVAGSVGRAYDANARVRSYQVNGVPAVEYERDADGLLTRAGSLVLERDQEGGFVRATQLAAVRDVRTFNGFGELAEYVARVRGEEVYREAISRDERGRIAEKVVTIEGRRDRLTYRYDANGQLRAVERNGAVEQSYAYDANGNRLSLAGAGPLVEGAYDERDRLLSYGATSYVHDASGDLRSRSRGGQVTAFDYDAVGNLVGVSLPGGARIDYIVDGRHRRIGKVVDGAPDRGFLYKDELQPIAELDGAGAVVSRFVYATRSHVPDYLVRGDETYRLVTDDLGSPRLVVNARTGAIAQRLDYDAFGRVLEDTRPGFQPFGFRGGIYDPDTGLTRFGARDYDAETGRWTRPHPLHFAGGAANLYAYVGNDPVNRFDPTGLRGESSVAWGTAAAVARALSERLSSGVARALVAAGAIAGGPPSEDTAHVAEALLRARSAARVEPSGPGERGGSDDGSSPVAIGNPADAGVPPVGAGGRLAPERAGIPPGNVDDVDGPCSGDDVCPMVIDGRLRCVPCASIGF